MALERTLAGEVVGTPLYMAPEQAAGKIDQIDEKTDIYGLGAILFAILAGCAPHEKSNRSQMVEFASTKCSTRLPKVKHHTLANSIPVCLPI